MELEDLSRWARGHGLEALLIALGAVLLSPLARHTADRLVERMDATQSDEDRLVASEASKHRGALVQGITWAAIFLVYFVAVVLILVRLNVPVTTLVARP